MKLVTKCFKCGRILEIEKTDENDMKYVVQVGNDIMYCMCIPCQEKVIDFLSPTEIKTVVVPNEIVATIKDKIKDKTPVKLEALEESKKEVDILDREISDFRNDEGLKSKYGDKVTVTLYSLNRGGIKTFRELIDKSEHDLLEIRNIGKQAINIVTELLARFNLALKENYETYNGTNRDHYTDKELKIIYDKSLSIDEKARQLGRTYGAVRQKMTSLKLYSPTREYRIFSDECIDMIKSGNFSNKEIADAYGLTPQQVANKKSDLKKKGQMT